MSINIGPPAIEELRPRILVIGVGGAGGNAIANMIQAQIEGVDFIVANTDAQALNSSIAENRIQLGPDITQGLGAGSRPEVGRAAAEETIEEIDRLLEGVHMVFIAAGMGGGTGTGAAPIIAKAARDKGVLTVGVVTKPFMFEGTRRMRSAETGIDELQKHVDTLIVIPNQNLFLVAKADTTFKEAFGLADEVLQQGVRSITDLMVMPGLINLDFADVRSVMGEMGKAMMGTGEGEGPNRALEAAERAIANPLLDGVSMQGAKGVIISIIGGDDMKLLEVDEAANHIRELVDQDANIIWGSAFNPDLQGKIRVSVVATGIEQSAEQAEIAARPVSFSGSRGPVRPGAAQPAQPVAATPSYSPAPAAYAPPAPPAAPAAEPFDLGSDAELGEDDSALELGGAEELGDESYGNAAPAPARQPAGLGAAQPVAASQTRRQDELNLQEEAAEPAPAPGRRRTFLSEPAAAAPAPAAPAPAAPAPRPASTGSTLFERMSNLSRGTKPAPSEEEGEEDSGSISIPRFLGRQNNQ
ncbi:cell division protein FtsZ [Novosphingobium chloroacetimidivorans]|uniref:Cell division protein FtsZ n=1 Tax=Novosphingobium chloroacetimidivorans TaxID=1428314 RepID=A0A7W7KA26_9SPHN|nr:cell division protein FtsZ [Novosphingobium chloroacetimidivorans]MBB4858474.1 cell division protein FtsZ [Novosphingobium chloroacetimidivorans]